MNSRSRRSRAHRTLASVCTISAVLAAMSAHAETVPVKGLVDSRVRIAAYNSDEVYRLHGYVGYQIDLQFERGETFVGLGAGDLDGLSFVASDNHLFIKPKAAQVGTNLTVLTTRRPYQFDYTASARHPGSEEDEVIYSLRFTYSPAASANAAAASADELSRLLEQSASHRPLNVDYWYCGSPSLKPVAASDDGVHTRVRFGARSEQPAIFVLNDDGTESLLNFSMAEGDVVVHRVVRQLIVRRGRLVGRIVNKGFTGFGERLQSGTVSPSVERSTGSRTP
ncbi:MAG: TrbG/VirB9 family P-type conjugative transfer protein [Steroidobacteraceae bacterium]